VERGKRGLYGAIGGSHPKQLEFAMLWVLNAADFHRTKDWAGEPAIPDLVSGHSVGALGIARGY